MLHRRGLTSVNSLWRQVCPRAWRVGPCDSGSVTNLLALRVRRPKTAAQFHPQDSYGIPLRRKRLHFEDRQNPSASLQSLHRKRFRSFHAARGFHLCIALWS